MDNQKFLVTTEWIHKHKTKKGGWTKAQIQSLGLRYPPTNGWIERISGEYIITEQARMFEDNKDTFIQQKGIKFKRVLASLSAFTRQELLLIDEKIKNLLTSK